MKKIKFYFLYSLFLLITIFLLLEIGIAALNLAPKLMPLHLSSFRFSENPKIGYELIPHYTNEENTAITELSGYAIDISNSNGFRDIERNVARTPGKSRVVALGDSITHGYFVKDYRDRYTDRLQEIYPNSEFINVGVSGYNTMQEVALFRERGIQTIKIYLSLSTRNFFGCSSILTSYNYQSIDI